MRFTVIGHSCLRIETSGPTILVDPWLLGSCYWRSWWHYPTVADPSPEVLAPDVVYLTHHHFDHFHFPSMRRLDRRAHVVVPKFGVPTLAEEVRSLGFDDVMELAARAGVAARAGGPDGVVPERPRRLRVRGRRRRARARRHQRRQDPRSNLAAHPGGIRPPDLRVQELLVRAGLPGALHRRRPRRPRAASRATRTSTTGCASSTSSTRGTACRSAAWWRSCTPTVVASTSTWSSRARSSTRSAGSDRSRPPRRCRWTRATAGARTPASTSPGSTGTRIATGNSTCSPRRSRRRSPSRPRPRRASPSTTRRSPTTSTASCTPSRPECSDGSRCGARSCSRCSSSPLPYWVLDFTRRAVYRLSAPPPDTASIVTVNEAVLADAISKRLVHVVHGSMRIRVHLRAGGAGDDLTFWGLVVPWELGYLPLQHAVGPRLAEVTWRRRAEWLEWGDAMRGGWRHPVRAHLRPVGIGCEGGRRVVG